MAAIIWHGQPDLIMAWEIRLPVPFTYDLSKNKILRQRRVGRAYMNPPSRALRLDLMRSFQRAILGADIQVRRAKVWIDLMVQKPDHRGDAVNVVDLVCDALKDALQLDDRWFALRRLDWAIDKANPLLIIVVGQELESR